MRTRAQVRLLEDGRRLHLHDGPIDLIVEAFGEPTNVNAAYRAAAERFVDVLDELCSELAFLRQATDTRRPVCHRVIIAQAHGGGSKALLRADFHHADGSGGWSSRGGNSGSHGRSGLGFRGLT